MAMQHRDSIGLFGGWSGVHVRGDAIRNSTNFSAEST